MANVMAGSVTATSITPMESNPHSTDSVASGTGARFSRAKPASSHSAPALAGTLLIVDIGILWGGCSGGSARVQSARVADEPPQ